MLSLSKAPRLNLLHASAFATITFMAMALMYMLRAVIATDVFLRLLAISTVLVFFLLTRFLRVGWQESLVSDSVLITWGFLLAGEQLFSRRMADYEEAVSGNYNAGVYGEMTLWIVCLVAFALVTLSNPQFLRTLIDRRMKGVALYTALVLASALYSETPAFSLAWGFKLAIVVAMLAFLLQTLRTPEQVQAFLRANYVGFAVLVFIPVAEAFSHPATAFDEGRLNSIISPVVVADCAGVLMILGMVLYAVERRKSRLLAVFCGFAVMVMCGGKAALAASMIAAVLFLLARRAFLGGIALLTAMIVVGAFVLVLTPAASYVEDYSASGNVATLTGRTQLWEASIPVILESPILGHGFVASRFARDKIDIIWGAISPPHLHSGFVETAYNNGFVGLVLMLMVNATIVGALWRAWRRSQRGPVRTLVQGMASLYTYLLLNAFVEPIFGGKPSALFMMFLSLVVVASALERYAEPVVESVRRPRTAVAGTRRP